MPEHHEEDRVRVRNIVRPDGDDVQTFWITRLRKVEKVDANGQVTKVDQPYEREIEWNFRDGFFFSWGQKFYVLRPGEEKTYPRFLAEHCAKHMVQYELNKRYQASKRTGTDGTPEYDRNILNNESLKKQLTNQIIVGVEEWYGGSEDDFDTLLQKRFGGDFEGLAKERVSNEDVELPEIPQDEPANDLPVAPKAAKPAKDPELKAAREEAEKLEVAYAEGDDAAAVKAKILKAMA